MLSTNSLPSIYTMQIIWVFALCTNLHFFFTDVNQIWYTYILEPWSKHKLGLKAVNSPLAFSFHHLHEIRQKIATFVIIIWINRTISWDYRAILCLASADAQKLMRFIKVYFKFDIIRLTDIVTILTFFSYFSRLLFSTLFFLCGIN